MSFESLEQDTYDIKSDVWSYGVLIVEALKCGDIPYPDGGKSWLLYTSHQIKQDCEVSIFFFILIDEVK